MSKTKTEKPQGKSGMGAAKKGYLFGYNFIQVIGWTYLLLLIINFYITNAGNLSKAELWPHVKLIVVIFQNAAVLEIIHAVTGLVVSNPVITTFQVLSRLIVVNGVLLATPAGPQSPGLPLCLMAWAITEIIRYLYYALSLINVVPYFLVWCRYTFFIVLYPLGVTGELLCFYWAQNYVKDHKTLTYEMPNWMNFTFNYHYFLLLVMFLYIPIFPQMYLHMFAQRRKIIGGKGAEAKKKKKETVFEPQPEGNTVVEITNENFEEDV